MCEQDGKLQNYLNYEIIMTSRLSLLLGQLGPYEVSNIFPKSLFFCFCICIFLDSIFND